jgi:Uri superfamily endonuclease
MQGYIPDEIANLPKSMRGAYILEFYLEKPVALEVGKLGKFRLATGFYYYVGSALNGLRGRLLRHIRGPAKLHWHIDYITRIKQPSAIWLVEAVKNVESDLTGIISKRAVPAVSGFGCSDSPGDITHLFYSGNRLELIEDLHIFGCSALITTNHK